jgi:hypothetical protein
MEISRGATLTVRFLCELGMLAALALWGFVVAGFATSLLNESQERRAGPDTIRRR